MPNRYSVAMWIREDLVKTQLIVIMITLLKINTNKLNVDQVAPND